MSRDDDGKHHELAEVFEQHAKLSETDRLRQELEEARRRYDAACRENKRLSDELAAVRFGVIPLKSIWEPVHRYRDFIQSIAKKDADVLLKKDVEYDGSWQKRGGRGAWFAFVRKWDRIEAQVDRSEQDVFEAMLADRREEGILDDIADMRRYLILFEAWLRARA